MPADLSAGEEVPEGENPLIEGPVLHREATYVPNTALGILFSSRLRSLTNTRLLTISHYLTLNSLKMFFFLQRTLFLN